MLKTGATVDGTGSHCHTITNVLERYFPISSKLKY
jgi:hypothetical protein